MAEGFDIGNLLFLMKAADAGFAKTLSAGLSKVQDVDSAIDKFSDDTTDAFRKATGQARSWVRELGRAGNVRLKNPLSNINAGPLTRMTSRLKGWTQEVRRASAVNLGNPLKNLRAAPLESFAKGLRSVRSAAVDVAAATKRIVAPNVKMPKLKLDVPKAAAKLTLGLTNVKDIDAKIEAAVRLAKRKLSQRLRMAPVIGPAVNLGPLGAARALMGRTAESARNLANRVRMIGSTPVRMPKLKMPTLPRFKPLDIKITARGAGEATRAVGLFAKSLATVRVPAALKQLPGLFSRIKAPKLGGLVGGVKGVASGVGGIFGKLGGMVSGGVGMAGSALAGFGKLAVGALGGIPGLAMAAASGIGGLAEKVMNFGKYAAAGLLALGVASIKLAADATEMESKFDVAFGPAAADARKNLDAFADSVGRSRNDMRGMAADIQTVFVPFGFARDQAAKLSQQMATLAVDMGSFFNTSDADAMEALQSAVVGNHETMRKYGVVITEATLKNQLLKMGVKGGTEAATEQQKVLARLALIMEGTKDAQGDAARTSGSFSNQVKGLWGNIKDLGVIIGNALIPSMSLIVGKTKDAIAWVKSHEDTIKSWGETLATWTATGLEWLSAFVTAVMNIDLAWETFKLSAEEAVTGVVDRVRWFAENVWAFLKYPFENFPEFVQTSVNNAWERLKNFGAALKTLFTSSLSDIASGKAFEGFSLDKLESGVKDFANMPEWKEFEGTDFTEAWNENARKWEERMSGASKKVAATTKKDLNVDLNDMMKNAETKASAKVKIKAEFTELEDLFKKNILDQFDDKDDTGKATVAGINSLVDGQKEQIKEAEKAKKELVEALGKGGSMQII